jgi:hypothetical protein
MKKEITSQQAAFFTKHGYIEFEVPHPPLPNASERDVWRHDGALKAFLLRKLGPIALSLTGKTRLRLGCDQNIAHADLPKAQGRVKELISLQGLAIGVMMAEQPQTTARHSPLGILPLPSSSTHVLFFRPELILDWPSVQSTVYFALFTLPNAVYVHNPHDPCTHVLKTFGYQYGDVLKDAHHPLLCV